MIDQDRQNLKIWRDRVEAFFPCELKFVNQIADILNVNYSSLTEDQKYNFYKLMIEFVDGKIGAYRVENTLLKKVADIFTISISDVTEEQTWKFYGVILIFISRIRSKYDKEIE